MQRPCSLSESEENRRDSRCFCAILPICFSGVESIYEWKGEVYLDLGNYERFLDIKLTRDNNITTGKIYQAVVEKERMGDYLGQTVQVVPHITDAIQEWIERTTAIPVDGKEGPADVCVIELGGNIGDIESMPYMEALGQFSYRVGDGNFFLDSCWLSSCSNCLWRAGMVYCGMIPHSSRY